MAADHVRVAAQPCLPEAMTDDCDRMTSRVFVFLGEEGAAQNRLYAEGVEIIGRYKHAPQPLRTAAFAEIHGRHGCRGEVLQSAIELAVIPVGGPGKGTLATFG